MSNKLKTFKGIAYECEEGSPSTLAGDENIKEHFPVVYSKLEQLRKLESEIFDWSGQFWGLDDDDPIPDDLKE